jgi:hypothetical protein
MPIHINSIQRSHTWEADFCSADKKFTKFMEPEGSLPASQETTTCLYPEPD